MGLPAIRLLACCFIVILRKYERSQGTLHVSMFFSFGILAIFPPPNPTRKVLFRDNGAQNNSHRSNLSGWGCMTYVIHDGTTKHIDLQEEDSKQGKWFQIQFCFGTLILRHGNFMLRRFWIPDSIGNSLLPSKHNSFPTKTRFPTAFPCAVGELWKGDSVTRTEICDRWFWGYCPCCGVVSNRHLSTSLTSPSRIHEWL